MWSEGWRMGTVAMQPKMAEGASLFRPTLANPENFSDTRPLHVEFISLDYGFSRSWCLGVSGIASPGIKHDSVRRMPGQ